MNKKNKIKLAKNTKSKVGGRPSKGKRATEGKSSAELAEDFADNFNRTEAWYGRGNVSDGSASANAAQALLATYMPKAKLPEDPGRTGYMDFRGVGPKPKPKPKPKK